VRRNDELRVWGTSPNALLFSAAAKKRSLLAQIALSLLPFGTAPLHSLKAAACLLRATLAPLSPEVMQAALCG